MNLFAVHRWYCWALTPAIEGGGIELVLTTIRRLRHA